MVSEWVQRARDLPVAFAQVREDPSLDLSVIRHAGPDARVMMIASGGCTAALLAASPGVSHLEIVDPNPAQIALARLKLHLLNTADVETRLTLLGHAKAEYEERSRLLSSVLTEIELAPECLGPVDLVFSLGPDHCGRYEFVFAELRNELKAVSGELKALLASDDRSAQGSSTMPNTALGRAIDNAFERVFAIENLEAVFGRDATQNPVETFSAHFRRRLRHVLTTLPARGNPYLSQMLLGAFSNGVRYPWLDATTPAALPNLSWTNSTIQEALATAKGERFDVVHLSNVLDWLSEEAAGQALNLAWSALRNGGLMILRQLNSSLNFYTLGCPFQWDLDLAARLHGQDRSFFYRTLYIGRKR